MLSPAKDLAQLLAITLAELTQDFNQHVPTELHPLVPLFPSDHKTPSSHSLSAIGQNCNTKMGIQKESESTVQNDPGSSASWTLTLLASTAAFTC